MTKKKMIKSLMGKGLARNRAAEFAEYCGAMSNHYRDYLRTPEIVETISKINADEPKTPAFALF